LKIEEAPLARVRATAPTWVVEEEYSVRAYRFRTILVLPSGQPAGEVSLTAEGDHSYVVVRETVVGARLPASCPDRHINPDGSFCIGINAQWSVVDGEAATLWWRRLYEYLQCQAIADKSGLWPLGRGMSHGEAGRTQEKAELVARNLGLFEEYAIAVEFESGWLASEWPKVDGKNTRLRNGRLPCPRGCVRRDGTEKLRCECSRSEGIARLFLLERQRRKQSEKFLRELKASGINCCGRLKECPLR
jgi:hypothetical protein